MKKLLLLLITLSTLTSAAVTIGQPIGSLSLNDQFDVEHNITAETKKVIFTFKKDASHIVVDYLDTKEETYLESYHAFYAADFSSAPFFVKWFIDSHLESYPYPILMIEDEDTAAIYKNEDHLEDIMIVNLKNEIVVSIEYVNSEETLIKAIEK